MKSTDKCIDDKDIQVVVEKRSDIAHANGTIIVTKRGVDKPKMIPVLYFTESQLDRISDAFEESRRMRAGR